MVDLFNKRVRGYYALFQITFPTVKEDRKPKRKKDESEESWARRKKAAYEKLTLADFTFQGLPLEKSPVIVHVSRAALMKYPQEDFEKDSNWAAKFKSTFKKKDGSRAALAGTLLLTARGTYESMEELLDAHQGLKAKKDLKAGSFTEKSGIAKGIEKDTTYVVGPLKKGWTSSDKQDSVRFVKDLLLMFDCFIAHAVYDHSGSRQVNLFREFREKVLRKTEAGRHLILLYYEYGPQYAMRLRHNPKAIPHLRFVLDQLAAAISNMDLEDPSVQAKLATVVHWTDKVLSIFWKDGESQGLGQFTRGLMPLLWDQNRTAPRYLNQRQKEKTAP